MQDVLYCLGFDERRKVINSDHALAPLRQSESCQVSTEPRLSDQEYLKQRPALDVEVGEHAELFQRRDRQTLCLVHDQYGARVPSVSFMEESLQVAEYDGLFGVGVSQAEGGGGH